MKWFENLRISLKVRIAFAVIYLVAGALGALGLLGLQRVGQAGYGVAYTIFTIILSFIIVLIFGGVIAKNISGSLSKLVQAAEKLAVGDTNINVKAASNDEIGNLAEALNKIADSTRIQAQAAEKIAVGELNLNLKAKSENDILSQELNKVANKIKALIQDVYTLTSSASDGNFDTRVDESRHSGEFKTIINGINKTLDIVVDKNNWYEAIIDAVPFPIHVTDNDMNWSYMNKSFEKLMIEQGVIKDRKSGYGKACSNAGANICNTQNCGIKQLLKGTKESYFDWCGMSCKQDTSFLKNRKGENIGFVEVVTDLTSILSVNAYSQKEIERLVGNLGLLAQGNLDMDLSVNDANQYTADIRKSFVMINDNLKKVKSSLNMMISDTEMLVDSAIAGKLETRADISKHQGDYKKIVEGVNATLDAITAPLNEAKKVLEKMAYNDHTLQMTTQYNGAFKEFAEAINLAQTRVISVQDALVRAGKGDLSRLEEFKRIGKRSENDQIMPAMINNLQSIKEITEEADMLAKAAINGDLSVRGDVSKFEGGFREIIEGINRTMDAVVKPIQEASEVMQEMAHGNLAINMSGDYKGDFAKIKDALNFTIQSFNEVLNDINNAASQVASGSRQVSDSAQALSQGSTEQASSIEELSASIEEISAQTKQNAINANQANELAMAAKTDAIKGNEQMKEMLRAMDDINESSANISKIIKVIDEIAFQTNILALNAAVEAARAGQHGKGFAVVAEEVRNLAARSANAAKETTVLIEGSIKKAEGGTKIASQTAEALDNIVNGIAKAASLVGEIASASDEQAAGIAQINQGIVQVSEVIQRNSATSEESAAASEELSSQAEVLKEMVNKFTLKKVGGTRKIADELSPDVMRMLETMADNKSGASRKNAASSRQIVLSDREFGKY